MNQTSSPPARLGFTSSCNQRGTLDIAWSCMISMFLCSWSIICMNVPGPYEKRIQILWRKTCLTILGILCPELLFGFACCQWLQARESVRDIRSLYKESEEPGDSIGSRKRDSTAKSNEDTASPGPEVQVRRKQKWNMKKAFYAEMGAIRLHTKDNMFFPIDAKQLFFLVSKKYIDLPFVDEEEIRDKNKSDGLLRAISLCQILWFMINVVGRWAQGLTVATLEVTTFSFILCSLGTALFWWWKPADVRLGTYIDTDFTVAELLQAEGQTFTEHNRTPLDFVNREEWWASRIWTNFVSILWHMNITFGSNSHPIDRIGDTVHKPVSRIVFWMQVMAFYPVIAVFFAAWNHEFPTQVERTLWRIATVTLVYVLTAMLLLPDLPTITAKISLPRINHRTQSENRDHDNGNRPFRLRLLHHLLNSFHHLLTKAYNSHPATLLRRIDTSMDRFRNNSPGGDPKHRLPLKLILPVYFTAFAYCTSRMYIIVSDFVELRSLPVDAYDTVEWQRFWPHFGG